MAKLTTVQLLLSLAIVKSWSLLQLDIKIAFLIGDLFEEVYMELPLVCKLNKSIYDLRQASRKWFTKFTQTIQSCGFTQSKHDCSLFTIGSKDTFVALLVYVDDIIISSPLQAMITSEQTKLQKLFKLKVLDNLKYFLGVEITKSHHGINLSQRKYTLSLLDDTSFLTCTYSSTNGPQSETKKYKWRSFP